MVGKTIGKKGYVVPVTKENSFVFRNNIALIFDPEQSGSGQLGKSRDDELNERDNSKGEERRWEDGLW